MGKLGGFNMRFKRSIISVVAVIALVLAFISGGAVAATAVGGDVSGTVAVGTTGGAPAAGLTVYLSHSSRFPIPVTQKLYQTTTTDGLGKYTFPSIAEGTWYVQVAPPADGSYAAPLSSEALLLSAQNPHPVADFILSQPGATMKGTVTSAQDGSPVPGAQVVADGPVELWTTTAADGSYAITGLPGGTYSLFLTASHFFQGASFPGVTVGVGGTVSRSVTMDRFSRVTGRVTSLVDGSPLAGIQVQVSPAYHDDLGGGQAVTNTDGYYTVETLPIRRGGIATFTDLNGAYAPRSSGTLPLARGQNATGVDAQLGKPTNVSGTLRGSDGSSTGLAGADLKFSSALGQEYRATTDAGGGYIVYSLPPGDYDVTIHTEFTSPFAVAGSVPYTVTGKTPGQTFDITAPKKGAVRGTVTVPGATSANPASVKVVIEQKTQNDDGYTYVDEYTQTVETNANGKAAYQFPAVAPELQNDRSDPSWETAEYVINAVVLSGGVGANQYPRTFWRGTPNQEAANSFEVPTSANATVLDFVMLTPAAFTTAPVPAIEGTPTVGTTLTLTRGSWSPKPLTYSYAWAADGAAIPGATSTSYTLRSTDIGKRITVQVIGAKPGFATTSRTSPASEPVRGSFSATKSFLTALYQDYLGRTPAVSEVAFWSAKLTPGVPRSVVSDGFVNSDEYRLIRIDAAYRSILGREPDASGRANWLKAMRQGAITTDDIETSFYASQEWYQTHGGTDAKYAAALYQTLLGRSGTTSDYKFWANIISTKGRTFAIAQFWDSNETISKRVSAMYEFYLGRTPDASGLAMWVGLALQIGDSGLRSGFSSSDEYYLRSSSRFPG